LAYSQPSLSLTLLVREAGFATILATPTFGHRCTTLRRTDSLSNLYKGLGFTLLRGRDTNLSCVACTQLDSSAGNTNCVVGDISKSRYIKPSPLSPRFQIPHFSREHTHTPQHFNHRLLRIQQLLFPPTAVHPCSFVFCGRCCVLDDTRCAPDDVTTCV